MWFVCQRAARPVDGTGLTRHSPSRDIKATTSTFMLSSRSISGYDLVTLWRAATSQPKRKTVVCLRYESDPSVFIVVITLGEEARIIIKN